MSEAAAALAGDPGGAPPVGGGESQVTVPDWAKGFEPDVAEWVGKKSFPDVGALAKSYRHLEQTFHADKQGRAIILPGQDAKPEEWGQIWDRLGRPKDPAGYGFEAPEGADPKLAEGLTQAFHAAGLNPTQAGLVYDAIKALADDTPDAEARAAKNRSDHDEIRREWGPAYEQRRAIAQRAARAMGIGSEDLNKIEDALGTRFVFEKMFALGEALREDAGVGDISGRPQSYGTPAAAQARIEELKTDKAFMARIEAGDKSAQAQWDAMFRAAYPS